MHSELGIGPSRPRRGQAPVSWTERCTKTLGFRDGAFHCGCPTINGLVSQGEFTRKKTVCSWEDLWLNIYENPVSIFPTNSIHWINDVSLTFNESALTRWIGPGDWLCGWQQWDNRCWWCEPKTWSVETATSIWSFRKMGLPPKWMVYKCL